MVKNKRVLVTGFAGSIGSELTRQLVASKNKVYGLDINETNAFDLMTELGIPGRIGDVRDPETVNEIFEDFKPEYVFHAAALKHVTPMEYAPIEAIKTNVIGTYNVLQASKVHPIDKFVFISTDKAVNSNSIMGATKRLAEIMTRNSGKGYIVTRFGNVLGSRGSLIPIWERQIAAGGPITVTDPNMQRFFMTIEEACKLVIDAADKGNGGEIIVLDMGTQVNILDLAKEIIFKSGRNIEIKITGMRPGETLEEKLMLDEEQRVAVKDGPYWIIR